ncbi:MAG TPA: flagellar hook capping FlgD N-terminal domain-containing protein [Symbiobacteriaceae bacterium]|nr:flagellar hook capping FlgD N-terminal domain-containing protein [Symbiobacteriaceae bacterium]
MAVTMPDPSTWYKVGSSSAQSTEQQAREPKTSLGKDDFLKLLITQMRHQDPLKPMEDRDYMAQLAQFSALEQMMNVGQATSMNYGMSTLGRTVTATDLDGFPVQGTAISVRLVDGTPMVKVRTDDDKIVEVELSSVSQVDME